MCGPRCAEYRCNEPTRDRETKRAGYQQSLALTQVVETQIVGFRLQVFKEDSWAVSSPAARAQ